VFGTTYEGARRSGARSMKPVCRWPGTVAGGLAIEFPIAKHLILRRRPNALIIAQEMASHRFSLQLSTCSKKWRNAALSDKRAENHEDRH
jgi:hypothetical protein